MSTPACRRAYGGDMSDQDIQFGGGILAAPGVYTLGGAADLGSSFDSSDKSRSLSLSLDDAMESLNLSSNTPKPHSEPVPPVIIYNSDQDASLDYTGSNSSWEANEGPKSPPISIVSNGRQNAFTLDDHDTLEPANGLAPVCADSPEPGTSPSGMRTPMGTSPGVRQSAGKQRMNSKRKSKRKK